MPVLFLILDFRRKARKCNIRNHLCNPTTIQFIETSLRKHLSQQEARKHGRASKMDGEQTMASVGRFLETFILVPCTVSTKTPCQTRFLFRRIIFRLEKRCRQTTTATGRGKWNDEGNIPPGFLFTAARKSRLGLGLPRRCRPRLIEHRVDKSKSSTPWKKRLQ